MCAKWPKNNHLKTACSAGTSAAIVANVNRNIRGRMIYNWLQLVLHRPDVTMETVWLLCVGTHVQLE